MDNDSQKHDDDTFNDDDDLFNGLSEDDYDIDESTQTDDSLDESLDDDLDSGYVHDSIDDEELYDYQDESTSEADEDGAYAAQEEVAKGGVLERFKHTLKHGSFSDKVRAILIPLIFGILIVGFCSYKILELFGSPAAPPTASQQKLNVRQYIERPKPPSDKLNQPTHQAAQKVSTPATKPSATPPMPVAGSAKSPPPSNTPAQQHDAGAAQALISDIESTESQTVSSKTDADTSSVLPFMDQSSSDTSHQAVNGNTVMPASTSAMTGQTTMPSGQLQAQLTQAQATLTQLNQQQQKSDAKLKQLQQQVDSINKQFTQLNNALKKTLVDLQKQITALNHARVTERKVAALNKKAQVQYTIQAIIPGRAWLKTQQGKIITVTRGNTVPGYGTVTDIDVENGLVRTRSGAVFSYALGQ